LGNSPILVPIALAATLFTRLYSKSVNIVFFGHLYRQHCPEPTGSSKKFQRFLVRHLLPLPCPWPLIGAPIFLEYILSLLLRNNPYSLSSRRPWTGENVLASSARLPSLVASQSTVPPPPSSPMIGTFSPYRLNATFETIIVLFRGTRRRFKAPSPRLYLLHQRQFNQSCHMARLQEDCPQDLVKLRELWDKIGRNISERSLFLFKHFVIAKDFERSHFEYDILGKRVCQHALLKFLHLGKSTLYNYIKGETNIDGRGRYKHHAIVLVEELHAFLDSQVMEKSHYCERNRTQYYRDFRFYFLS